MIVELNVEDGDRNIRYDLTAVVEDGEIESVRVTQVEVRIGDCWDYVPVNRTLSQEHWEQFRTDIEAAYESECEALASHMEEVFGGVS